MHPLYRCDHRGREENFAGSGNLCVERQRVGMVPQPRDQQGSVGVITELGLSAGTRQARAGESGTVQMTVAAGRQAAAREPGTLALSQPA